jgi:hypothetical protein
MTTLTAFAHLTAVANGNATVTVEGKPYSVAIYGMWC